MDILKWLDELGLSRYTDTLSEFPIEDIIEFTDDDFKELGVLTPHRKKLLVAIKNLKITSASENNLSYRNTETASSLFSKFIRDLPQVIAIPLHEYAEEDHPGMKLWAACDAVELLLKFLVIIGAADRRQHGELDDKLLKELWGKIEMPTLGAWLSMAISLSQSKIKNDLIMPEIDQYVNATLKTLLYGPDNPGTADTSFLKLRNRLAHGGGLTRKEAERLISIWKDPFEKTIEALDWLRDIKIIGLDNNVPMELKGTSDNLIAADNLDISQFKGDGDGVWLIKGGNTLSLWPMALFGYPSVSNAKGNVETGDINSIQIYIRKDVVQLQFTPLGAEGFSHSEAGVSAVEAFKSLFSLKRANQKASEKAFKIQDFGREIQKDANQMVGRFEEQEHIENSFKDIEQGIVWITGPAGIGKSFLVARLAQHLIDNNKDKNKIILPYRFKSGDDARCSRDAFATFTIERLVAMGALIDNAKIEEKGKAEDRLKACLNYLNKDKKVIFVLDGLDELLSKDTTFAEDIPLGLDSTRIIWVCSGRPESELEKVFNNPRVINPYPNGLPAMQIQDIRSMLLERIGLFRNKLLAGDKEKGDEVVNPFIDLVAKRAEGLPLFVNYVTQDVQQGNYPLDGTANLPKGLTAYHEKLIEGLEVGALKELLTPLVATLAMANEPLSEQEIITFLRLRDRIPDGEAGDKLVTKGLAAIASILRRAPDPEGEDGYMLHHLSLREHILTTETMSFPVEQARKAFAKAAMSPDEEASISNYLYRTGIDHLIDAGKLKTAGEFLIDFDRLETMFALGKTTSDINGYWNKLPISTNQLDAIYLNQFVPIPILSYEEFGDGKDWSNFVKNEIYDSEDSNFLSNLEDFWLLESQKVSAEEANKDLSHNEIELQSEFDNLLDDSEDLTDFFEESSTNKNEDFFSYCRTKAKEYIEIEETGLRLSLYYQLSEFFLLAKLTHSGVEICKRICRSLLAELGPEKPETIMAHARLSAFYAQWDGQDLETEINEHHLFYNNKIGTIYLKAGASFMVPSPYYAPEIFRYCLKLICDKVGLKSSLLSTLLSSPALILPAVGKLNIKVQNKTIMNVSDLLRELFHISTNDKGKNHLSTIEINLNLANRLYFELNIKEAYLVVEEVYKNLFKLFGLNDHRSIKALEIKGNIAFELGNFQSAKDIFEILIKNTDKKYLNPSLLNEWSTKLAIIEFTFKNFEEAENLCQKGLLYFDDVKSNYSYSISDDRIFILIRSMLSEIKNTSNILNASTKDMDEDFNKIIDFYLEKGLYESCLFYLYDQEPNNKINITEILKFMRILKLYRTPGFSNNFNFLISRMSPRQERIIRMRYKIGTNTTHSIKELATQFNESHEQIKLQIIDALNKIRL